MRQLTGLLLIAAGIALPFFVGNLHDWVLIYVLGSVMASLFTLGGMLLGKDNNHV